MRADGRADSTNGDLPLTRARSRRSIPELAEAAALGAVSGMRQVHHGPLQLKGSMSQWKPYTAALVRGPGQHESENTSGDDDAENSFYLQLFVNEFSFAKASAKPEEEKPQAQFSLSSPVYKPLEQRSGKRDYRFDVGVVERAPLQFSAPSLQEMQGWGKALEFVGLQMKQQQQQQEEYQRQLRPSLPPFDRARFGSDDAGNATLERSLRGNARSTDLLSAGAGGTGLAGVSFGSSLFFGDHILLRCGKSKQVTMHGDGLCRTRVGAVQEALLRRQREQCIFLVCPALRYDAELEHEQLNNNPFLTASTPGHASRNEHETQKRDAQVEAKAAQQDAERRRSAFASREIRRERETNERVIAALAKKHAGLVTYGEVVQLQHVRSGKFVTVCEHTTALQLVEGGTNGSKFVLRPRYGGRNEGGRVHFNDYMRLESYTIPGRFLHTEINRGAWEAIINYDEQDARSQQRSKKDEKRIFEVNAANIQDSDELSSWQIVEYAQPYAPTFQGLCANDPFRLFHPHQRSFVTAYTGWRQNPAYAETLGDAVERLGDKYHEQAEAVQCFEHLPFMRQLVEGGDAVQSLQQSSADVWTFELLDESHAGVMRFNTPLRIKHLPTRTYLGRETEVERHEREHNDGDNPHVSGSHDVYQLKLWCAPDEHSEHYFNEHCTFEVYPDEHTDGDVLPAGVALSLRIRNVYRDGGFGAEPMMKPSYLHLHAPWSLMGSPPSDIADSFAGEDDHEPVGNRLRRLELSNTAFPEDTIRMMPVSMSEARQIEAVRTCKGIARLYENAVLKTGFLDRDLARGMPMGVLGRDMRMVLRDAQSMLCTVVSLVSNVGAIDDETMSSIAALGKLTRPPKKEAQNIVKDLGLLNGLFAMLQAVVNANKCHRDASGGAAGHALKSLHVTVSADQQLIIHRGVFMTINKCFAHNRAVQYFFGRQRILIPSLPKSTPNMMHDTFIHAIIRQVGVHDEYEVGATLCLKELITDNQRLLEGNGDAGAGTADDEITELIRLIVHLIKEQGRKAVLLDFLSTTCCCQGRGIPKNQRTCMLELFKDAGEDHTETGSADGSPLLQTRAFVDSNEKLDADIMKELHEAWARPVAETASDIPRDRVFCYGLAHRQAYEAQHRVQQHHPQLFPHMYVTWESLGTHKDLILTRGIGSWQDCQLLPPHKAKTAEQQIELTLSRDDVINTSESGEEGMQGETTFQIKKKYAFHIQDSESVPGVVESGRHVCEVLAINKDLDIDRSMVKSGTLVVRPLDPPPPRTQWLAIEMLCWVLDPYFMLERVWPHDGSFNSRANIDRHLLKRDELKKRFHSQVELAKFYVAQITLFSDMCHDRNYLAIERLSRMFPYEMLLGGIINTKLPFRLRGAYVRLLQRLHVDRYPQVQLRIPTRVHPPPSHTKKKQADFASFVPPTAPDCPLREHALERKRNRSLLACGDTKFRLLRDFIEYFFQRAYASKDAKDDTTWRFHNVERDNRHRFTLQVTELLQSLVVFGFYSDEHKIKPLIKQLVAALDGRRDHISQMGRKPDEEELAGKSHTPPVYKGDDGKEYEWEAWHVHGRYKCEGVGSHPKSVTMMKMRARVCDVLLTLCNLRADYRLRLFVKEHEACRDKEHMEEFLFGNGAQALFGKNNSHCVDLGQVAQRPLDRILLDLLMYDSPELFKSAFALLMRRYGQKSKFVEAITSVVFFDVKHNKGLREANVALSEDSLGDGVDESKAGTEDESKQRSARAYSQEADNVPPLANVLRGHVADDNSKPVQVKRLEGALSDVSDEDDLGAGQLLARLRQLVVDTRLKVNQWPWTNDTSNPAWDERRAQGENRRTAHLLRCLSKYVDHRSNNSNVLQALHAHDIFLKGLSHKPADCDQARRAWHELVAECLKCLESMVHVNSLDSDSVQLADYLFARLATLIELIETDLRVETNDKSWCTGHCLDLIRAILDGNPAHCKVAFAQLAAVLESVIDVLPSGTGHMLYDGNRDRALAVLELLRTLVCPDMTHDEGDEELPWCCQRNQEPVLKLLERVVLVVCGYSDADQRDDWHEIISAEQVSSDVTTSILDVCNVCCMNNPPNRDTIAKQQRCGDPGFRRAALEHIIASLTGIENNSLKNTLPAVRWQKLSTLVQAMHHIYYANSIDVDAEVELLQKVVEAVGKLKKYCTDEHQARDFAHFISCSHRMMVHFCSLLPSAGSGVPKELSDLNTVVEKTMLMFDWQRHSSTAMSMRGSRPAAALKRRSSGFSPKSSRGSTGHSQSFKGMRNRRKGSRNSMDAWSSKGLLMDIELRGAFFEYLAKCRDANACLNKAMILEFDTLVDIVQNVGDVSYLEGRVQQYNVLDVRRVRTMVSGSLGLNNAPDAEYSAGDLAAKSKPVVGCVADPVPGHSGEDPKLSFRRRIAFDELVCRLQKQVKTYLDTAASGVVLDDSCYTAATGIFNVFRRYIGQFRPLEASDTGGKAGISLARVAESLGHTVQDVKNMTGLGSKLQFLDSDGNMTKLELRQAQYHDTHNTPVAEKHRKLEQAQDRLDAQGCTQLFVSAIIAGGQSSEEENVAQAQLFWSALHFGCVMLERGNSAVQATLHELLKNERVCTPFLASISLHLQEQAEELLWSFDTPDDEVKSNPWVWAWPEGAYESILRFLQLCCEGHNRDMQNLLCCQPNTVKSINFVTDVQIILRHLAPSVRDVQGDTEVIHADSEHTEQSREHKEKKRRSLKSLRSGSVKTMRLGQKRLVNDSRRRLVAITASLKFLIEAMEGPCKKNQDFVSVPGVPETMKTIIHATNATIKQMSDDYETQNAVLRLVDSKLFADVGAATMKMASAMLEGQDEMAPVHNMLRESIGTMALCGRVERLHDRLEFLHDRHRHKGHVAEAAREERVTLDEAFDLFAVTKALTAADEHWLDGEAQVYKGFKLAYKALEKRFGSVEVAWNGSIHCIFFQMPRESNRLDEVTKKGVDAEIDLGGGRLNEFVTRCRQLSDDLEASKKLSRSRVAAFLKQHFFQVKYALYGIVLLLNWLILASVYAPLDDENPLVEYHEDSGIFRDNFQYGDHISYATSTQKLISYVLTIAAGVGYAVLTLYELVSQWPLVRRRNQDERRRQHHAQKRRSQHHAEEAKGRNWRRLAPHKSVAGHTRGESARGNCFRHCSRMYATCSQHCQQALFSHFDDEWGDWSVFVPVAILTLFLFLVWAIMFTHGDSWYDARETFISVGMVLLLLTLLRCLRSFWGNRLHNKKGSRPENMYCKVYDVICHPQAIVHMLLCTFAFATLTSYRFAPLLLMDVATFNKTLGNVVLAATKPYKELLMTLALALIIVFIYTSFGMYSFGETFHGAVEPDHLLATSVCPDLLRCYAHLLAHGITRPDELQMDTVTYEDHHWTGHLVFNLTFFIVIGALLLNMVTGVIVDTFSELREDAKERRDKLNNVCFICGIERAKMDELGAGNDFEEHIRHHHDRWSYFYFLHYIWHMRDPMEYNGVESYVDNCVKEHKVSWIPNRRWLKLQKLEQTKADEAKSQRTAETKIGALSEQVERLSAGQDAVMALLSDMKVKMDALNGLKLKVQNTS